MASVTFWFQALLTRAAEILARGGDRDRSMRTFRITFTGIALCVLFSGPISANDGLKLLARFFKEVDTLEADFQQVVLDENLLALSEAAGHLWISRPRRFRWDYDLATGQSIVADGRDLWAYDAELEQVIVRDLFESLGESPAMLLSGEGGLEINYIVKSMGKQGMLEWVSLVPRTEKGNFSEVQLGFEGNTLRLIQLLDKMERITRLTLSQVIENKPIDDSVYRFTPPAGVDIIDESG